MRTGFPSMSARVRKTFRAAVSDHMVEGQRKGHHLARADHAFRHAGFFNHAAHAQNGGFRRIDNGGKAVHAQHAHVGDGEAAALDLVHGKAALAGAFGHVAHLAFELFQTAGLGIFHVGHDEARFQ